MSASQVTYEDGDAPMNEHTHQKLQGDTGSFEQQIMGALTAAGNVS